MPRKIGGGGRFPPPLPNQFGIAQGDQPITPIPPGKHSVPQPSAQPSRAWQGKGKTTFLRLYRKLKEEEAKKAQAWAVVNAVKPDLSVRPARQGGRRRNWWWGWQWIRLLGRQLYCSRSDTRYPIGLECRRQMV